VYEQAIQRIEGGAVAGDELAVLDPRGNFIGRGFYSPGSAIPVRILVRDPATAIDVEFFRSRIERAVHRRRSFGLPSAETNALRLVNAEGDDLPGLILDWFADVAVVQLGTVGMKRRESMLLEAIERVLSPKAIIDRTSAGVPAERAFSSPKASCEATPAFRPFLSRSAGFPTSFRSRSPEDGLLLRSETDARSD